MNLIEWRPEYSVGVPAVDHEHQLLISLINDAHARIQSRSSATEIQSCLAEIHARIAAHFALEEKIMREYNYDRLREHKADHERLLDEIRDLMDEHADSAVFDEQRLAERLNSWFLEHFRTEDARMHRMLPHA